MVKKFGGDEENRTPDPLLARQVLSQLSYAPNLLKVEPSKLNINLANVRRLVVRTSFLAHVLHRKEVIQPHLPIRLPCYDFTPIIGPTLDGWLLERLPHRLRVLPTFVV